MKSQEVIATLSDDSKVDLGQATMADCVPVAIASDQSAIPTKPQAPDGNASEFSCATVGAHAHVSDLSTKQTLTKPEGATGLLCQDTGTANIRWTVDGTDPTSTLGFQLRSSADPVVIPCPGAAIEMIQEAAGAALDYQWVK